MLKCDIARLVDETVHDYDRAMVEETLDNLKNLGFHYATRAGVTIGVEDVTVPPSKQKILDEHEKMAQKVEGQYRKGIITDDERRQELIEIWTQATDEVKNAMEEGFTATNPIFMMANSGARGNIMQIRQLAGMRGLVANPKGEIIPRPIKSNFREGLSVLEYFISTHGARKGLADTALRTADSGYLTRRLVDVAQELIIREDDCGSDRSIPVQVNVTSSRRLGREGRAHRDLLFGRVLAEDVKVGSKKVALAGEELDRRAVRGRRGIRCRGGPRPVGHHVRGRGRRLPPRATDGTWPPDAVVEIGEAVGIIAAQSIGEPGTQLTMRTFHTGGVAGEDITHGLPRVVELFEARKPKGEAQITELSGTVSIEDDDEKHVRRIRVTDETGDMVEYPVSFRARLTVSDGETVEVGQRLTEGSVNPHEKLRVEGVQALQMHLVEEVQQVYRSQGVTIHDKHIELIVRQMLRKVHIIEPGDTDVPAGRHGGAPASSRRRTPRWSRTAACRPRPVRSCSASRRRRSRRTRGCRRPRSRRRRGCSPTRRSAPSGPAAGSEGERDHRQADPRRDRHAAVPQRAGQDQARGDPGVLAGASARDPGGRGERHRGAGARRAHPRAGGRCSGASLSAVSARQGVSERSTRASERFGPGHAMGPSAPPRDDAGCLVPLPTGRTSLGVWPPIERMASLGVRRGWHRAGQDVASEPPVAAVPVGDHPAGLLDQQAAGRHVPRRERQLEEPVEDAGRHPREVQAAAPGRRRSSNRARRALERRRYRGEQVLAPEREPGADRPLVRSGRARDTVQLGTGSAPPSTAAISQAPSPRPATHVSPRNGAHTRAGDRPPVAHERHRHADRQEPVGEVRGAVERIDHPGVGRCRARRVPRRAPARRRPRRQQRRDRRSAPGRPR